jgi:hypothetical protein
VWDGDTGAALAALGPHEYKVTASCWAPDGRHVIAAGSKANVLTVWETAAFTKVRDLVGHEGTILAAAYSPDGEWIVSGAKDATIRIWSPHTGEQAACFTMKSGLSDSPDRRGPTLKVTRGGRGIVAGDSAGLLYVLEASGMGARPPLVTGVRLYRFGNNDWDADITIQCPWCGGRFPMAPALQDAIHGIAREASLAGEQSPARQLPGEVWGEPRLGSECGHCRRPLRSNPFIVDNRDGN